MDEAARRVNVKALARLAAVRRRREETAARALRELAGAREAADAARAQAAEDVKTRKAERRAGERAIYAALTASGPMELTRLENRQRAVTRLGETVAAAQASEAEQIEAAASARAAHEAGRVEHARRARATQKLERARDHVLARRRALAEAAEEIAVDDEVALRFIAQMRV